MKFAEVVGQDHVKQMVVSSFQEDRLAHAFLFLGPAGLGGLPLGLSIAQYLMCTNKQTGDSCGECPSCHKVSSTIHPDLHFTFPAIRGKSSTSTSLDWMKEWRHFLHSNPYGTAQEWLLSLGGENKQGNITKDECLRIVKTLGLKAFESDYRVQIIWMAEYLAKEGNRLLKLIEEPPSKTVFMLIAEDEGKVLNTILSRCQIVRMKPATQSILATHLVELGLPQQEAEQIAGVARGNTGTALNLKDSRSVFGAENWLDWMRILYKNQPPEMVAFSDQFAQLNRESQKAFLNYGLHFMRQMINYQTTKRSALGIMPPEELQSLEKLADLIPSEASFQMVGLLEESLYHLERYANPRLVMLDNSIQIGRLFRMRKGTLLSQNQY